MWKKTLRIIFVVLLFLLAVGMIAYPYIANYLFENRNDSVVGSIEKTVDTVSEEMRQQAISEAQAYNLSLFRGHVKLKDPFEVQSRELSESKYKALLNLNGDGVMGLIEIPAVGIKLPIYHTTSDEVLEKGVGHLEGTSLPVGGEDTNCVLTGHTGLSNAKLFTDLTELTEGDYFFLQTLGEKLAYKVDKISVVLPNEVDEMYPVKGMDLCTLVTCTPYGVNSHRLIVRGIRTDYQEAISNPAVLQKNQVESKWMLEYKRALLISAAFFALGVVLFIGGNKLANRKQHSGGRNIH